MSTKTLPEHIAIIMDGNRRWARQRKLPPFRGHEYMVNQALQKLIDHAIQRNVSYLTLWALSTENWDRDPVEIAGLMKLFRSLFKKQAQELHEKGVRIKVIGRLEDFPEDIQQNMKRWVEETAHNTTITVTFALSYGGRDEITRAINAWKKAEPTEVLTKEIFSNYLDTAGTPDPDLIIRPGGEKRLSGFLSWQSGYSELYFTDVLMPDFNEEEFDAALAEYKKRARRFGK